MNTSTYRLRSSLAGLRRAVDDRREAQAKGESAELLDRGVCLEARELFFRYADVGDRIPEGDEALKTDCVEAMQSAVECLAGSGADNPYYESVFEKNQLLRRIVLERRPIDEVLQEALTA